MMNDCQDIMHVVKSCLEFLDGDAIALLLESILLMLVPYDTTMMVYKYKLLSTTAKPENRSSYQCVRVTTRHSGYRSP